jgi:hypothetical protein
MRLTMQIITETPQDNISESSGTTFFTPQELDAMNRYCLRFRDLVRAGGTPSAEQEASFMRYQQICYSEGAAHE